MSTAKAVLTKRFQASVETVYEACTDPSLLVQWLGPEAFKMETVEADVRIGGRFWFRMSGEGGTYAAEGFYQVVDPPHKLQLSWRWTEGPAHEPPDGVISQLTLDFARDGDGTLLTLTHEGLPSQKQADSHAEGWGQGLEKLVKLLEDVE